MNDKMLSIFIVISFAAIAWGDEYRSKVNEGYEYYKNGDYDKATENYRQAGIIKPDKALPNFGKGAALYRSNDFEEANKEYSAAIEKGGDKIKADAHYNTGNAFYKAEKYGDAVKSYVNALGINSDDKDYKHNLEMALLKQQMQQQQQQQQDQGDKEEKQNQQDKKEGDQNQQDQQQKDQEKKDTEKKEQQQQRQSAEEQMSEDDAKNLLSRFEEDEKEIQKRLKQVNIGRSSGHDW